MTLPWFKNFHGFLILRITASVVDITWNEVKCYSVMPSLCDSMDCSPPGSSVHGIFQASVLEWHHLESRKCPVHLFISSQLLLTLILSLSFLLPLHMLGFFLPGMIFFSLIINLLIPILISGQIAPTQMFETVLFEPNLHLSVTSVRAFCAVTSQYLLQWSNNRNNELTYICVYVCFW